MRIGILLAVLLLTNVVHNFVNAQDSSSQPFTVFVSEDGSYARCGPAPEHYRTDKLSEGDRLEVYMETEDGWLGIRPTDSSFCWLPASQVDLAADGIDGRITDQSAVAWIGTNLGKARKYRWQVQFQLGEPVAVIGSTERQNADGKSEVWYRIVPPPGEFRWVHDSQVVRTKGELATVKRDRRAELAALEAEQIQRATVLESDPPSVLDPPPKPSVIEEQPIGSGVRQASFEESLDNNFEVRPPVRSRLDLTNKLRVREITSESSSRQNANPTPSAWVPGGRRAEFPVSQTAFEPTSQSRVGYPEQQAPSRLKQLQLEFAQHLASRTSPEELEQLKSAVRQVIEHASEAADRGRARMLLDRIDKYQEVTRKLGQGKSLTSQENPGYKGYDHRGWLVQAYSARPDAPPFALTDRNGKVIAYVSPSMGTNIRSHLNQEVGIIGKPSYHTGIDSPLVVAEQVVTLRR